MNRRVVLLLVAASAAGFAADPLPSAESILDRYIEVTGGKQAYENRKTQITHGIVEFPSLGIKGAMTRYAAQPDKYYYSVEIEAVGKMESGVNGRVAWENSVFLGPRLKTGVELDEAIREGSLNSAANWRKQYPQVARARDGSR